MRKPRAFPSLLAMLFFLLTGLVSVPAVSAITIDGIFDEALEWAGFHAADDGVGGSGYVGPGYGGQLFDVEYIGLKPVGDKIYFGIQTGFDLPNGSVYEGTTYHPGDLALDVDGDGFYEYAIDFNITSGVVTFDLYEVSTWQGVKYSAHAESNPFQYASGTWLASFGGAYGAGVFANNSDGGTSHVLEGGFEMSLLGLYAGGPVTLHWTMDCGNDHLEVTSTPVPEPSTLILVGSGGMGVLLLARRRGRGFRQ